MGSNDEDTSSLTAAPLQRGDVVSRYVILEQSGVGGMGVVYAAYDPELDRRVALKILHPRVAGAASTEERLLREARAMARLNHPNVITVHDVGTFGEHVFVAMEYVEGQTLREWLRAGDHDWATILDVFMAAGRGLEAAHANRVIHRDFKPDNVMVGRNGSVRVTDFGLARSSGALMPIGEPESGEATPHAGRETERLTRTGATVGTPAYMAPEQYAQVEADARGDQFSYCVSLFEALYSLHPFAADSAEGLKTNVAEGRLNVPAGASEIPARLLRVLRRGLAVDRADRYPDMTTLLAGLRSPAKTGRLRTVSVAAVFGVALVAAAGVAYTGANASGMCENAERHLNGVWDGDRRQGLKDAFAATNVEFADTAAMSVGRILDARAKAWLTMRTEACRATRVHGEQSEALLDARMVCLDQKLAETKNLVDVFLQADSEVAFRAVDAVSRLTPIEECDRGGDLIERRDEIANLSASDQELYAQVRQARTMADAGKNDESQKALSAALEQARTRGLRALEAEALYGFGIVHNNRGEAAKARENLLAALWAADATHQDRLRMQILTALAWTYGHLDGKLDAAEQYTQAARAAHTRVEGNGGDLSTIINHEASFLVQRGKYDEAITRYEEGLATRKDLGLDIDPMYADMLNNLGGAYFSSAKYDEALEQYQRALALHEQTIGSAHPTVGEVLSNIGNVHQVQGRFEEALDYFERGLALKRGVESDASPALATTINNKAVVLQELGRLEEAVATYEHAIRIWDASAPEHPNRAVAFSNLAEVELLRSNPVEALHHATTALEQFQALFGEEHPYCAYALANKGRANLALGNVDPAVNQLESAVALFESAPADPVAQGEAQFELARALRESSPQDERIEKLSQQALAAFKDAGPRGAERAVAVEQWLANR